MRTNIEIDDKLMKEAMKASRVETKTKKAVVEEALQLLVNIRGREKLRDLFGKVEFWEGYDYKAMRRDDPPADIPGKTARKMLRRLQGKRRKAA